MDRLAFRHDEPHAFFDGGASLNTFFPAPGAAADPKQSPLTSLHHHQHHQQHPHHPQTNGFHSAGGAPNNLSMGMSGLSVNPPHPAIAEQGGMAGYSTQVNGALLPQQQHQPGLSDMRPLSQGNAEGSSSASARRSRPSPTASEHPHNFFPPSSPSVHSVHSATSFSGGHAAHHYPSSMAGSPPSPRPSLANSSPVNVKMEGFSSASGTDWVEIGPVPGSSRTRQASGHSTSTDHNGLPTRADSLPGSGGHPRGPGSEGVKTESAGASPASNSGGALGISAEHGQASPDIKISPGPWGSAGPSSGSAGAGAGAGASTCGADPASASGVAGQDAAAEKRQSSKFVFKLFKMVSDADYQHLISWNASGTSVVVTNFDEFARSVLGKHFKHSNFSSFIRQLNMYGFYKVNKTPRGHRNTVDTQVWEFSHPKFLRGRPDLLDDIRRKALDSEHARVEARDLQYSVSVGQMQLRQQVDEMQYRLDEAVEQNMGLRHFASQLREALVSVLEYIKMTNGGQMPFDVHVPAFDLPMPMHPAGAIPWQQPHDGGPPIFVTEPQFGDGAGTHGDPRGGSDYGMDQFGFVGPPQGVSTTPRRVSSGSAHSEGMYAMGGGDGMGISGLRHDSEGSSPSRPMTAHQTPAHHHHPYHRPSIGEHGAGNGAPGAQRGIGRMQRQAAPGGLAIDTSMGGPGPAGTNVISSGISPTSAGGLTASNAGIGGLMGGGAAASLPPSPLTPQGHTHTMAGYMAAINTPLPPSPAIAQGPNGAFGPFDHHHHHQQGGGQPGAGAGFGFGPGPTQAHYGYAHQDASVFGPGTGGDKDMLDPSATTSVSSSATANANASAKAIRSAKRNSMMAGNGMAGLGVGGGLETSMMGHHQQHHGHQQQHSSAPSSPGAMKRKSPV